MTITRFFLFSFITFTSFAMEPEAANQLITVKGKDGYQEKMDQSLLPFNFCLSRLKEGQSGEFKLPYDKPVVQLITKALTFLASLSAKPSYKAAAFFFKDVYGSDQHIDLYAKNPELVSQAHEAFELLFMPAEFKQAFLKCIVRKVEEKASNIYFEGFAETDLAIRGLIEASQSEILSQLCKRDTGILYLNNQNIDNTEGIVKLLKKINVKPLEIRCINLHHNRLRTLDDSFVELIDAAHNLEELWLNNNILEILPESFLIQHKKLKKISVSCNYLRSFPECFLQIAPSLEMFSASFCKLEKLPETCLNKPTKLKCLYLECNHLKTLPDSLVSNAPDLTYIELEYNQLTRLPRKFAQASTNLSTLVLDKNPGFSLKCSSDLAPHVKAAAKAGIAEWRKIKTRRPTIGWLQTWLADEENSAAHKK